MTMNQEHKITTHLSDEAHELLQAFADEQGIDDLGTAVEAMIHELVALHDQLWELQFARSTEPLKALAREVRNNNEE